MFREKFKDWADTHCSASNVKDLLAILAYMVVIFAMQNSDLAEGLLR